MRWKALAEIYTMHFFAPFFNLKISAKIVNIFSRMKNEFPSFEIVSFFALKFAFFCESSIFGEILSGFRAKF